jgi:hypothetical protein
MGLFKALTALLVGFFGIFILNKRDTLKSIPIFGEFIHKHVDKYKAELIVAFIAAVFLFI